MRTGSKIAGFDAILLEGLKVLQLNLADISTIMTSAAPLLSSDIFQYDEDDDA